jgi:L-malate glycosyltransferase
MKIAYILPSLARTGPNIMVWHLVNYLKNKAEKICIYYFRDIAELDFEVEHRLISLQENIPFQDYDIIHSHMLKADYYVWKKRKKIRAQCISTIHQYIGYNLKSDYNALLSALVSPLWFLFLRKQDHLVFISNSLKVYYQKKKWIQHKSRVIYNGIPDTYTDEKQPVAIPEKLHLLKRKYIVLGNFSIFTHRKGLDQIIDMLKHNDSYALLLIGKGPELKNIERSVASSDLQERVLILPFQKDLQPYYQILDIFVMPSRSEAFGLSMMEAVAARIPVVCSGIAAFRELFSEKQVHFFTIGDRDSLINACERSIADKNAPAKAYEHFLQYYSIKHCAEAYWDCYCSLLQK